MAKKSKGKSKGTKSVKGSPSPAYPLMSGPHGPAMMTRIGRKS